MSQESGTAAMRPSTGKSIPIPSVKKPIGTTALVSGTAARFTSGAASVMR